MQRRRMLTGLAGLVPLAVLRAGAAEPPRHRIRVPLERLAPAEREAAELARRFYAAKLAADTDALSAILAPGFVLIHMTGYRQSRGEWLSQVRSGEMRYFSAEEEELSVRLEDGGAEVTTRNRVHARVWGAEGTWNLRIVFSLGRDAAGGWQILRAAASSY